MKSTTTTTTAGALCRFVPKFLQYQREAMAIADVTPARVMLMQALYVEGDLGMAEIADRLSVTKRNITGLVDGMERDGLVVRRAHPTDRRIKLIRLTAEGQAMRGAAMEALRDGVASLMTGLAEDRCAALAETLGVLSDRLDRRRAGGRSDP